MRGKGEPRGDLITAKRPLTGELEWIEPEDLANGIPFPRLLSCH